MSEESHRLRLQPRLKLEVPPPPEPVEFEPPAQNPEESLPALESRPEQPAFAEASEPAVETVESTAPDAPVEEPAPAQNPGEGFPAFELPLEAPPFPEASQPPIELPGRAAPMEGAPSLRPKMTLRRRNDEPGLEIPALPPPPFPISRPPSPVSLPLAATKVPPAPSLSGNFSPLPASAVAANRKVKRAAIGVGLAGAAVLAIAGFLAYRNFISDSKTPTTELASAERGSKSFFKKRRVEPVEKPAAPESTDLPADEAAKLNVVTVSQGVPTEASPAFQTWVHDLKINGVRAGATPRIVVARKLYTVGEIMNVELGITFEGYDAARHILRFKDKTGFILEREEH
jgi:hypothetical protein